MENEKSVEQFFEEAFEDEKREAEEKTFKEKGEKGKKFRAFFITDFQCDEEFWKNKVQIWDPKYFLLVRDVAPTTYRKHLHAVIYFQNPRSWNKLREELVNRDTEGCRSIMKSINYCLSKCAIAMELGDRPEQGKRSDLDILKEDIIGARLTVDDICLNNPTIYHQYGRTLQKIEEIKNKSVSRNWKTVGVWISGETGVGKTKIVFDMFPKEDIYVWKLNDHDWQDNYNGEPIILIDDLRFEIKFNEMLSLLDRYSYTLPRRGKAPTPLLARMIIITSIWEPAMCFPRRSEEDSIEQLNRRLERQYIFEKDKEGKLKNEDLIKEDIKSLLDD